MTRAIRTNPAYAFLAYRKAVLEYTIGHLMTSVIGANGADPTERVLCEDVFREDEEVPKEDVFAFVEGLEEEMANVKVQMGKFQFKSEDERKCSGIKRKGRGAGDKTRGRGGGA